VQQKPPFSTAVHQSYGASVGGAAENPCNALVLQSVTRVRGKVRQAPPVAG